MNLQRGQHFLLNVLGALFVIASAVYVAVGSYRVYPTVSSYTARPTTVTDIVAASKVTCPRKPLESSTFFSHERQYHAFDNILLIVFFSHARYDANLDYYKEVYSEFFPNVRLLHLSPFLKEVLVLMHTAFADGICRTR